METAEPARKSTLDWKIATGICAALLLAFALLSYFASCTKNATYDEPLHTLGGILHRVTGEFRLDTEDPPFFGLWASLPVDTRKMWLDFGSPEWQEYIRGEQDAQWMFTMNTLYTSRTLNDGDAIIQRSRMMFTLVGILLGALIAWSAWQLGGAWAAVVATAFYALDPNFLAHASLVKNDVMLALLFMAVTVAMWRFGRSGSLLALAGMAVATALAVNVKFSAILLGPIIFITLLIRALLPSPWTIAGRSLTRIGQRLVVVPAACLLIGAATYLAIWMCYGLRFAPASDHTTLLDMAPMKTLVRMNHVRHRFRPGMVFPTSIADNEPLGATVNLMLFAESHHLLPQAWLYGFIYTYATTLSRTSYLMGETSNQGFRLYFPLAMLFKTPTATLLAIPASIAAFLVAVFVRKRLVEPADDTGAPTTVSADPAQSAWYINWWTISCFVIPPGVYFSSAIMANMNIGLRHILPVDPFIFIALAIGFAKLIEKRKYAGLPVVGVLLLGVAIETLAAYPDYIAFFNAPTGGSTAGAKLLSDSNLDWGQDLKQLGVWQKRHTDKPLYLNYFGSPNPEFYDVHAIHMPGGWNFAKPGSRQIPTGTDPCYVAISATNLQGVYYAPEMQKYYFQLNGIYPTTILGGSIYIYELPAPPNMFRAKGQGSR